MILIPHWCIDVQVSREVRALLQKRGRGDVKILLSSDLDEYAIAALAAAPVDGYGVGTSLVTGSGHPTCGFVYKLVCRAADDGTMVDVAKASKDKVSIGGRKFALRRRNVKGCAEAEVVDPQVLVDGVDAVVNAASPDRDDCPVDRQLLPTPATS